MSNVIPLVSSTLVREEEVTIGRLSSLLTSCFIDHEEDEEGDLFLHEGLSFPIWVSDGPESSSISTPTRRSRGPPGRLDLLE